MRLELPTRRWVKFQQCLKISKKNLFWDPSWKTRNWLISCLTTSTANLTSGRITVKPKICAFVFHVIQKQENSNSKWKVLIPLDQRRVVLMVHFFSNPEGVISCDLFQMSSIINEVDLYSYLVPPLMGYGLTKCDDVARTDRLRVLAHAQVTLPWPISNRELLLDGFGVDMLDLGMIMVAVRDYDSQTSPIGVVPELKYPKINIFRGGALIKPLHNNKILFSLVASVDLKLRWIPNYFFDWAMNTFAPHVFQYLARVAEGVGKKEDCPYKSRIESRIQFYGYLRERLQAWEASNT
eukprot:TRINITY_DN15889_c0_g1_i2.p1 TRINITY_DN15889_c0_g1~~TRINITY_DN15889_c0_g1_i2.p1  ORF type:complete len:295 (-),score=58.67 TRINITY_DN15889_c0_g1_i2:83-967(-)